MVGVGDAGVSRGDADGEGGSVSHTGAPSGAMASGEDQASSARKTTSNCRRRARAKKKKKKQVKKANRKKEEKRQRQNENSYTGQITEEFSFSPAHTWHNWHSDACTEKMSSTPTGKCKKGSRTTPRPRDCYDESKSASSHNHAMFHSWINELSWFGQNEKTDAPSSSQPVGLHAHDDHVRALAEQLESLKERMWPAALRCAAAYNAMNFGHRTPETEFVEARRACNHFEWLGEGQRGGLNKDFVNRSAIKLTNIDALLDFTLVRGNNITFVDLCGAPGGWSEYVMFRCRKNGVIYNGYGMSLGVRDDGHGHGINWKLDNVGTDGNSSDPSSFRICKGDDGTGDVCSWRNVVSLRNLIAKNEQIIMNPTAKAQNAECKPGFVDLVVADGGFDEQRNSTQQEALAHKLVTSQAAAAMELLRPGGNFIMKMFGCQTDAMRNLVGYLSVHFDRLTFLKPISSRPASAERYLFCHGFAGMPPSWDGQAWIERILGQKRVEKIDDYCDRSLLQYLDRVDADIYRLNIKACSSILTYLESKAQMAEAGDDDDKDKDATSYRSVVDVLAYKHAWKLQQQKK